MQKNGIIPMSVVLKLPFDLFFDIEDLISGVYLTGNLKFTCPQEDSELLGIIPV